VSRPRRAPTCDCPRARHEHGNAGMYERHGCHCPTCQPARIIGSRARKPLKHDWSDPALARERIALLRASGLSLDAISEMSTIHIAQLRTLLPGRGRTPVKKVRTSTLNALLAIRARDTAAYDVPARAKVSGESARLQLQSLYCHGWSVESLGDHAGLTKSALYRILAGENTTENFRLRIDALHEELSGHRAPRSSERDQKRAVLAVAKAAANNWTPDTELAAERIRLGLALAA
jgi:lambda repressor-like predicted transcriptional regulator